MEESEKLNFLSTILPLSAILFIIVLGVLLLNQQFNKKLYRQKLEGEQLKSRHQRELLRSSIQVQEEERKRIAGNLHDELGAALSMTRMHLMQLEQQTAASDKRVALGNVREMTEAALASMRRISHEILPPQLEAFGLIKTLEATAAQINKLHGLNMEIAAAAAFPRLPLTVELGLYRICMELINNTLKHAGATEMIVSVHTNDENLTLDYSDNGTGLPRDYEPTGLGHQSIEARTQSLSGTFTLTNGDNGGIKAVIRIPLYN